MKIEELKINYCHDSLNLAQKAVYTGIIVSALAYLSLVSNSLQASYLIPFVNVPVASLKTFSISLVVLYFFCGAICAFGAQRALLNLRAIEDKEIAKCILNSPNIILSNVYLKSILYSIFFLIGVVLVSSVLELKGWQSMISGSIIASPYFYAFRISEYFKCELKSTVQKSPRPTHNGEI